MYNCWVWKLLRGMVLRNGAGRVFRIFIVGIFWICPPVLFKHLAPNIICDAKEPVL